MTRRQRRRPLGDHAYSVLLAVMRATLGRAPVTLEAALRRKPSRRDWGAAELLVERRLIAATTGAVKILPAGARVLGRIP